jgi:hypothetical protein
VVIRHISGELIRDKRLNILYYAINLTDLSIAKHKNYYGFFDENIQIFVEIEV